MSSGNWRKSKHMSLTNRGLETHIGMKYLPETRAYRVTRTERMIGGIPTATYDRILDGQEAIESFRHLCVEAIELDFTFPEHTGIKLIDLKATETE